MNILILIIFVSSKSTGLWHGLQNLYCAKVIGLQAYTQEDLGL